MEDKLTKLILGFCGVMAALVVILNVVDRPVTLVPHGTEYGDFSVIAQNEAEEASVPVRMDSVQTNRVNVNTADKETLMSLDGIGETLAQRIIDERNFMSFDSVEDLLRVDGIGEKILEKLRPYIVV
ncbi:MAG: helix-hairpin-helix domain-containing protein [Oscillospiraceae bacterium]|nr:helix-hairpin-helix domain-containing protein [Oscillospiraceae bacterium]